MTDSTFPLTPALTAARADRIAIPSGRYTLTPDLDRRIREAAAAPEGDGIHAHPIFAFVVALGGLGVPVEELCRMCDSSLDAGPVLARCRICFERQMLVARTYEVGGAIIATVTKPSRRFGSADHVTLALSVRAGGQAFAEVELAWIMPRQVQ